MVTRVPLDEATIIDMAAELLDSHGSDKLTLTLIANHLGVTQPALYKHVDGIDAVWRGLGLRERAELESRLASATIGLAGDDAVWAVARAWRDFSVESTTLYAIGDRYPVAGDPELESAVGRVLGVIVAALRGYELDERKVLHAAVGLRSALHGFCVFELNAGNPTPLESDELFTATIELFLSGIHALAPSSTGSTASAGPTSSEKEST